MSELRSFTEDHYHIWFTVQHHNLNLRFAAQQFLSGTASIPGCVTFRITDLDRASNMKPPVMLWLDSLQSPCLSMYRPAKVCCIPKSCSGTLSLFDMDLLNFTKRAHPELCITNYHFGFNSSKTLNPYAGVWDRLRGQVTQDTWGVSW